MTMPSVTLNDVLPLIERLSSTDKAHLLSILSTRSNENVVAIDQSPTPDEAAARRERVQAVMGKYRDDLISTDEFLRLKHEDNEREEQRWRSM